MSKDFQAICIFEDTGYKNLYPLTYTRPTWGLRCGMTVLLEKILRNFRKVPFCLHCRDYLADTVKSNALAGNINKLPTLSTCLFINGRVLAKEDLAKKLNFKGEDVVLVSGQDIVAARLSGRKLEFIRKAFDNPLSPTDFEPLKLDVSFRQTDIPLINYPWDLVAQNEAQIVRDFDALIKNCEIKGNVHQNAFIYEKENVYIEAESEIMANVVIDGRNGPVYIGKGVEISPNTRIEGPCYIGDKTKILGGKIRAGCSIGPFCKIGGELEETIIQGYSNKQHYGFLGHAYIGEWVNLGAGTTNSDLKNNYSNVKVWTENGEVDSGQTFVGCFIGDHTKTGIGTLINTGSVIGVSCNIFGGGLTPKFVPSFSWGGEKHLTEHDLDASVKTARTVMSRRGMEMNSADEVLLRKIFEQTKSERSARIFDPAENDI